MIDELRRRGLFAVLLTAEAGSPTQVHVVHSENMTDDDAISMLKRHVASLSSGDEKKPAKTGLLGRMFGGDEG
jgi:hypothetical protein